ncbi:MAG: hypothetical protein KC492_24425 [Myxococcales bacterium]|nr:hypothetical protein [Myxococcales bacterium]
MTKTATTKTPAPTKRNRRTPEQIVADLEAKIEDVRTRAARRAAKQAPEGKAFLAASRAVSKALEAAHGAKDQAMAEALQAALGSLAQHAKAAGIEPRSQKGPKAA